MTILTVLTAPDPILKQKSLPVKLVDSNIRKLMDDMLATMHHDNGVGLAAVQVGVLQRVIVLDLKDEDDDEKKASGFYPLFMANPEIINKSSELCTAKEGCLSVPDQRIEVMRPNEIVVKFLDYNNNQKEITADEWLARVVQHEMDHLDGRLIIDYLSSVKKDMVLRKLKKHKRDVL